MLEKIPRTECSVCARCFSFSDDIYNQEMGRWTTQCLLSILIIFRTLLVQSPLFGSYTFQTVATPIHQKTERFDKHSKISNQSYLFMQSKFSLFDKLPSVTWSGLCGECNVMCSGLWVIVLLSDASYASWLTLSKHTCTNKTMVFTRK